MHCLANNCKLILDMSDVHKVVDNCFLIGHPNNLKLVLQMQHHAYIIVLVETHQRIIHILGICILSNVEDQVILHIF